MLRMLIPAQGHIPIQTGIRLRPMQITGIATGLLHIPETMVMVQIGHITDPEIIIVILNVSILIIIIVVHKGDMETLIIEAAADIVALMVEVAVLTPASEEAVQVVVLEEVDMPALEVEAVQAVVLAADMLALEVEAVQAVALAEEEAIQVVAVDTDNT